MIKEKSKKKYWENEEYEIVEIGKNQILRCYDKSGKLQFCEIYFDSKTGEKKMAIKFVLDRDELFSSKEGAPYLRQTLEEWQQIFEGE